jgi:phosphate starvation-inducible PhoH-like protein
LGDDRPDPGGPCQCFSNRHLEKENCRQTKGQQDYLTLLRANEVVFGLGPAGTGKTYMAVARAVEALKKREVERIILSRPAVEAGERLGLSAR